METTDTAGGSGSTARGLAEQVREQASSQLSTQKNRAMDSLGSIAQAARQTTQSLRDNQQNAMADYVNKAADQIERFSTRLRERDVADLMQDAQQFARRQPAVFIGAAFAAGLLAARFLKSSTAGHEYSTSGQYSGRNREYTGSGQEYAYGRPGGSRLS